MPADAGEYFRTIEDQERAERERRGLPLYHVLTFDEYPFKFTLPAIAALGSAVDDAVAKQPTFNALLFKATIALARRDYAAANADMDRAQALNPSAPRATMRFGLAPQEGLQLPDLQGEWPREPALLLFCDAAYFPYLEPMLQSVAASNPQARVHAHVFGEGTPAVPADLRFSLSREVCAPLIQKLGIEARSYFHAARLVRFADALEAYDRPLITTDVDGLVTGDIAPIWNMRDPVAMRVRPGRFEPWHQFSACFLFGNTSGRAYFRRAADLVRFDLPRAWWGLDQYALFSAYLGIKPALKLLGPDIVGVDPQKPGLFWFTAREHRSGLSSDDTPYAKFYRDHKAAT